MKPAFWTALISSSLALGLALVVSQGADAAHHEKAEAAASLYVVKVHADWCGTCTKLTPTWAKIEQEFGTRAAFVVFDVTDKDAVEASGAEADALGLRSVFDAHKSKTGTIALVNGKTKEVIQTWKGELDFATYQTAIEGALSS